MIDQATALPPGLLVDPSPEDDAVAQANALPRRSFVEHHMAMAWSVHVRGPAAVAAGTPTLVAEAFALVARVDAELSPFRPDSALNAYRAGALRLADAPASLRQVHRLCEIARDQTDGVFDAWGWRDGFDPTGLTKGWAIGAALASLAGLDGDVAVVASGDLAVRSPSGLPWRVGIEDPRDRHRLLSTVDVVDAGVATSGTAARGLHVVDPRDPARRPAAGVASATVVAPDIVDADVWASATVALGGEGWTRMRGVAGGCGVVLTDDGTVHSWAR